MSWSKCRKAVSREVRPYVDAGAKVLLALLFVASILAVFVTVTGCEKTENNFTEPIPIPGGGGPVASATCQQDGDNLLIVCRDSSRDPQGQVVDDGVRFTARKTGSGFQATELGGVNQQVVIDVSGGGAGSYVIDQELLDDQGRVLDSNTYSVQVNG